MRAARLSSIKQRNLVYYPDTYQFWNIFKYTETLPPVERKYSEANDIEARLEVPEKSANLDSHYELRNSKNYGEDLFNANKNEAKKNSTVFNIYKHQPDLENNSESDKNGSNDS